METLIHHFLQRYKDACKKPLLSAQINASEMTEEKYPVSCSCIAANSHLLVWSLNPPLPWTEETPCLKVGKYAQNKKTIAANCCSWFVVLNESFEFRSVWIQIFSRRLSVTFYGFKLHTNTVFSQLLVQHFQLSVDMLKPLSSAVKLTDSNSCPPRLLNWIQTRKRRGNIF